ncbi:MAG: polyphosphate polymerase domain-containing protein [Verrucomicrobia bacterium]|nr:polyphosphate polymerase domain-containing protein [Verrucomicrobiota bacterium]
MGVDRLQLQRLELKYIISEETALAVREFVRAYLSIDEYGLAQPDLAYAIHSLYLDSPRLKTYWDTINGDKNRYKLRIRYYDDQPDSPVFFEIKRRVNDAILKQRAGVHRWAVADLVAGFVPGLDCLFSRQPNHLAALERFIELVLTIHARPVAHVCYRREAWVSEQDNSVRVTMDRQVRVQPQFEPSLGVVLAHPASPFGADVILELKFTGRFPNWFSELVRVFGLTRTSAAKYADGVAEIGEEVFYAGLNDASDVAPARGRRSNMAWTKRAVMG